MGVGTALQVCVQEDQNTQMADGKVAIPELRELCKDVCDRLDLLDTRLLREFRIWGVSFEGRLCANEVLIGGFSERLVSLEESGSDIERRKDG